MVGLGMATGSAGREGAGLGTGLAGAGVAGLGLKFGWFNRWPVAGSGIWKTSTMKEAVFKSDVKKAWVFINFF